MMTAIEWSALSTQTRAKAQLQSLIDTDAWSIPVLLYGQEGVGKSTHALSCISQILKTPPDSITSHPDVRRYQPEGKSFLYSTAIIDDILSDLTISPHVGEKKCYLLTHIECMLPVHANALLKALEELPEYAVVFLCTNSLDHVIQTIVSRCTRIAFHGIPDEELCKMLHTKYDMTSSAIQVAVPLADGSVTSALCVQSEEGQELQQTLIQALKASYAGDVVTCMQKCEELDSQLKALDDPPVQHRHMMVLLTSYLYWHRDIALLQETNNVSMCFHKAENQLLCACLTCPGPAWHEVEERVLQAKSAYLLHSRPKYIWEYLLLSQQRVLQSV